MKSPNKRPNLNSSQKTGGPPPPRPPGLCRNEVDLQHHPDGTILPVSAQPRAKQNGVVGIHAGRLKVAVTQAPEKGKANAAIQKLLASKLGLKRSQITLVSGETSREKKFLVEGLATDDVRGRIEDFTR